MYEYISSQRVNFIIHNPRFEKFKDNIFANLKMKKIFLARII